MRVKHTTKTENIFSLDQGCCKDMLTAIKYPANYIYADSCGNVLIRLQVCNEVITNCPWCGEKIFIDWCNK